MGLTPEETIESAARALWYRDMTEYGIDVTSDPWEEASETAKDVYRKAVTARG